MHCSHYAFKITTSGGTRTHNPRLRRPVPYPLGHRGLPELQNMVSVVARKSKTPITQFREKFRGHPGLNQGPLDLQSNALPLSYIPDRENRFPANIHLCMAKSIFHVRARASMTTTLIFVRFCSKSHYKPLFWLETIKFWMRNAGTLKTQCEIMHENASTHQKFDIENMHSRDRIVVSTLRCGRNNPGSNPGHGTF